MIFGSSLRNSYARFLAEVDRVKMVNRDEARYLIDMAKEVNDADSGLLCARKSSKGDGHLRRLLKDRWDHFEPSGEALIKYWLIHHSMPRSPSRE